LGFGRRRGLFEVLFDPVGVALHRARERRTNGFGVRGQIAAFFQAGADEIERREIEILGERR